MVINIKTYFCFTLSFLLVLSCAKKPEFDSVYKAPEQTLRSNDYDTDSKYIFHATNLQGKRNVGHKIMPFHKGQGQVVKLRFEKEGLVVYTEEKDEKLSLLMELRKFKKENETYFRKLKTKSKRQRVGRKNSKLSEETMSFIRNDRRNAFYHIDKNNQITEKTFVETASIFKAEAKEKAVALHKNHHEHVQHAIDKFDKEQQENLAEEQSVNPGMSPQAGSALSFLDACSRFDFLDEEEKLLIQSARKAIQLQKFANLQREINRIRRAQPTAPLKPPQLIDAVINILKKYPLDIESNQQARSTINPDQNINPEIIISESFL